MTEQDQYIKMCIKSEKYLWKPDYVFPFGAVFLDVEIWESNNKQYKYLALNWSGVWNGKPKHYVPTWSQEQLQGMVFTEDHGLQTQCYRIYQFSISEPGHGHTIDGSMRQLLLAFVMWELHQKKWTKEDWE